MGCGGTKVDHEASALYMKNLRSAGKNRVLVLGIKDQNYKGKVYLSGGASADPDLMKSVNDALVKTNSGVARATDKYDVMWDAVWHETKITCGMQPLSFTKPFFPRGKSVVALLDALGAHGWVPTAAPNFGGAVGEDSVDWPSILFEQDSEKMYAPESLFFAVKDQNTPGKLCAAGPQDVIETLKASLTSKMSPFMSGLKCEHDSYDTLADWDVVWMNTSVTSGIQALSFAKPYFPKGAVVAAILDEVYKLGWRLVAAPNFGGGGVDWPCFIFRRLNSPGEPPPIIVGAIKDQNMPGKLCLSGSEASTVAASIAAALQKVEGNGSVRVEKDDYDNDWDAVLRETKLTNGVAAFSWKLSYFPRSDSINAVLSTMNELGWSLAACPNFGGLQASWPSFVWEKRNCPCKTTLMAVKDQNIPGKVCFGGGGIQSEGVHDDLLKGFKALAGGDVESAKDTWDESFDFCFRNTKMTTGSVPFSFQNAWWPYGFALEMVVSEMRERGWKAVGGPNFGSGNLSWPALVFEKSLG